MRKLPPGFTLIELMITMVILVILAGLVVGIFSYVNITSGKTRAAAEIAMLSGAIKKYEGDNGVIPRNNDTDGLMPVSDFDPRAAVYEKANFHLYQELCGGSKPYLVEFDRKRLLKTNAAGEVKYFQDPFGYPYGYSTAAAKAEEAFREKVKTEGQQASRGASGGYNVPTYDLWSTANHTTGDSAHPEATYATWQK